ncbi:hypothetical protein FOE67_03535 [Streptomyces calidiresistens]|uniref:Uncharacterized protein n=1 Tax=Streptomyces calidiresistens TaxID=1485586 RepID=A0A7W3XVC0_9ACTN|nr:hypothetical protein [Streptomyces calidiresistens]MBB0228606.1 hypothetical protein [Streptomyces calidiresistens]
MPPVRLPREAELAAAVLAAPLPSRALRLARELPVRDTSGDASGAAAAGEGIPLEPGLDPTEEDLARAVRLLGLAEDPEGASKAAEAWAFAIEAGLVEVVGEEGAPRAVPAEGLADFGPGSPAEVLERWYGSVDAMLAELTSAFVLEDSLVDEEGETPHLAGVGEDNGFLEAALASLYLMTVSAPGGAAGEMVPLPVVAAGLLFPEEPVAPDNEALEQVSVVMTRLDSQFAVLAPTGMIEHQGMDPTLLIGEEGGDGGDGEEDAAGSDLPPDAEEERRYGRLRLTPLGLYAVRRRLAETGMDLPVLGEAAGADASRLLTVLAAYPEAAARQEAEGWLARREPEKAARELLAAARGSDPAAPGRRLECQSVLSLLGDEAAPALREVLDDPELGGLARVWLTEHGVRDVPAPSEEMVFWLTVDTLAARVGARPVPALFGSDPAAVSGGAADEEELRELVDGLVAHHTDFFDRAWRVDHPATADVLEAMSRLHPDRRIAKQARRAAFRARSRG